MEFQEYLKIIKKYKRIFFTIWFSILFLGMFTVIVQPVVYEGILSMMVVRDNNENVKVNLDKYDYYYQLESNEKISKMLVQVLKDEALLVKVFDGEIMGKKMKISREERQWVNARFKGKSFASGYTKIYISSHQQNLIKDISERLAEQLNTKIEKIGVNDNYSLRLEIEPVIIREKNKCYLPVGLGTFFGGFLVAIFGVLTKYYWKK